MKINKVTFTGADDNTKYDDLLKIQEKYPFVEWGILFSGTRKGTEKYPTQEWINNLPKELNLSAHFCGKYSKDVIEELEYHEIGGVKDKFKRIQLNYIFKNDLIKNLVKIKDFSAFLDINLIFQYNKQNSTILDEFMKLALPKSINFLNDNSGGRGIEIEEINRPFKNYTGYSGGIGPENVFSIANLIQGSKYSSFNDRVWIDMEGKVRTNGKFDLEKVKEVLQHFSSLQYTELTKNMTDLELDDFHSTKIVENGK